MVLAMVLAVPVMAFHTTTTFTSYKELEPILENWQGTLDELNSSLEYACKNANKIAGKTTYSSDFSDTNNLKFGCKLGTYVLWDVGSNLNWRHSCSFNWNTKIFKCTSRAGFALPFLFSWAFGVVFPVPIPD